MTDSRSPDRERAPALSAHARLALTGMLVLAAAARLAFAFYDRANYSTGNASGLILSLANSVARGEGFSHDGRTPDVFMEPAYPLLIALTVKTLGYSWLSLAILHASLSVLLVLLTFLAGRALFGNAAALWSAAGVAVYPYLVVHGMRVNDTLLCSVVLMLFAFSSVKAMASRRLGWAAMCGVSFGLGLLTRSSFLALSPLILLVAVSRRCGLRKSLEFGAVILGAAAATVGPWVARNYAVSGRVFISLHGGWPALWWGNNEHALKYLERNISLDAIFWNHEDLGAGLNMRATWRTSPQDLIAVQPEFRDAALAFLRDNPELIPKLVWYRAAGFWSVNLNPRPASGAEIPAAKQWAHRLTYGPMVLFALLGVVALGRRWKKRHVFILLAIGLYFAPHLLVWGASRLRLPLDPLIALFAGFGFSRAVAAFSNSSDNESGLDESR